MESFLSDEPTKGRNGGHWRPEDTGPRILPPVTIRTDGSGYGKDPDTRGLKGLTTEEREGS